MNIVKLKDIILDESCGLSPEKIELFNTKFKGRYVHCINWTYLVPLEEMTNEAAIELSKKLCIDLLEPTVAVDNLQAIQKDITTTTSIDQYKWFYLDELTDYVDVTDTEKVNAIYKYIEYNSFTPDKELTLEQIKIFRTWLATVLFNLLSKEPKVEKNTIAMLNYYMNDMNDSVIDTLASFHVDMPQVGIYTAGVQGVTGINILSPVKKSSCSCTQSSTAALLAQSSSVSVCDPIAIYRKALYSQMVDVFSDIKFWMKQKELLPEIKRYIDAIIKLNLPLTASQYVSELYDCNCLTSTDSAQERLMSILKNLSTAFDYMANDKVTGNKNFIGDTLNQWATKLYEIMLW